MAAAAWAGAGGGGSWGSFGNGLNNLASQDGESKISAANVGQLAMKWKFTTAGDVSARAAVVDGVAYFPDWAGYLYAVKTADGQLLWKAQLSSYGLAPNTNARATPTVDAGVLYLGTQEGAWLLAIDAQSGALKWKTQLESPAVDPFAIISSSATIKGGTVFVGVASSEEGIAGFVPSYPCCNARGSVVAVHAATGAIKWKTYTTPAGYAGAGVWGSNPVVAGGMVYVSTGNNYSHAKPSAPSSTPGQTFGQCIGNGGSVASCASPDNFVDSVVALNEGNGKVVWSRKLVNWNQGPFVADGSDDWNVSCFLPPFSNCPSSAGPDYDFGSAPNLISYDTPKGKRSILGAGQKSGIYYALDPKTGELLWSTQVGPGSTLGGMEWGSASDGKRIYVQVSNLFGVPWGGGAAGLWAALDPATGAVLWRTADPNGSLALGPMAVANGVVYAASMGGAPSMPTMLAFNAATGNVLWSFAAGSSVNSGATIVDGVVYWGSGYAHLGIPGFTGNNAFYAFSINGL